MRDAALHSAKLGPNFGDLWEEEEEEAEETERIRGKSILFSPPPPRSISYEKLFVPTSQISRGGSLVRALKKYYRSVSIGAGQSITGMILGS